MDEAERLRRRARRLPLRRPDVAVLDYSLPDGNGAGAAAPAEALDAAVPLVILTAHGSIDLAVQAVKEGAEHFLTKPVELPRCCC